MNVAVEGKNIDITAGESILCALRRAGTDFSNPAEKPVAAMIGGEVFNLITHPSANAAYGCCDMAMMRGAAFMNARCNSFLLLPFENSFRAQGL